MPPNFLSSFQQVDCLGHHLLLCVGCYSSYSTDTVLCIHISIKRGEMKDRSRGMHFSRKMMEYIFSCDIEEYASRFCMQMANSVHLHASSGPELQILPDSLNLQSHYFYNSLSYCLPSPCSALGTMLGPRLQWGIRQSCLLSPCSLASQRNPNNANRPSQQRAGCCNRRKAIAVSVGGKTPN